MKVATILGTRPEIIRLSLIIPALDRHCRQVLVHTGQNHDAQLSDVFFRELGLRAPDRHLGVTESQFGAQAGQILDRVERLLLDERPDRVLILGDTNSALASIVAKRLGIAVFHMEAGNRCWDDRVPEEVNRRIVDHASDVLLPYTERSRDNLLREGISPHRIFVTGNPIAEVLAFHAQRIDDSPVLDRLGLERQRYFLATVHRSENVDDPVRLSALVRGLGDVARGHGCPVVVSTHPRLRHRLAQAGIVAGDHVRLQEPFGLCDFVCLERHALCVLSDSGTVQEECAILGVASVTVREVTERPETRDCGANVLAGCSPDGIGRAVKIALAGRGRWQAPPEYREENVAETVLRLVLGHHHGLPAGIRS